MASLGLAPAFGCSSLALSGDEPDNYSTGDSFTGGETRAASDDSQDESEAESDGDDDDDSADLPGEPECEDACDPWDENSCEEGFKCSPVICEEDEYNIETFACRPAAGDAKAGDSCEVYPEGGDSCAPGHHCWEVDEETGEGHCEPLCTGTPETPSCEPGRVCAMFGSAGLSLCVPTCNPLAIECPAEDSTCLPLLDAGDFACLPNNADGAGLYGDTCEFSNACAPGLMCVDALLVPEPDCELASGCCTEFCEIGGSEVCTGVGQSCVPLEDLFGVAGVEFAIGICAFEQIPSANSPEG